MRILHTADWHLGKRLGQFERTDEQFIFLEWLLKCINEYKVDVLIVAGDIFDTGNPSNSALKLYYDFLWQVKNTACQAVIIVGGNHDSVSTLDAPKDLLRFFNVHVVGGIPDKTEDQIIPVTDKTGNVQLVICAVPFLRDRDIKLSVSGETDQERESRIKKGIENHYVNFIQYIKEYKEKNIPVIATGHLFAAGSQASPDSEKEIHIGNLGQVSGSKFPAEFDYIALGHLHRPQVVNKMNHIRYSGSPIALSFSENKDDKIVIIADFTEGKLNKVEEVLIPDLRRLVRIKGDLNEVKDKLINLDIPKSKFKTWIEIQLEVNHQSLIQDIDSILQSYIANKPDLEILFIKQICKSDQIELDKLAESESLDTLDPLKVFEMKCRSSFPEGNEELVTTFKEAIELMQQVN